MYDFRISTIFGLISIVLLSALNLPLAQAVLHEDEKAVEEHSISALMAMAYPLESTMPDSAIIIYRTTHQKALAVDSMLLANKSLQYLAYTYMGMGVMDSARHYLNRAIVGFTELNHSQGLYGSWNGLANIALYNGNNLLAINHYQKALEFVVDKQERSMVLLNMTALFQQMDNYEKVLELLERIDGMVDEDTPLSILGDISNNKATAYLSLEDLKKAEYHFDNAIDYYDGTNRLESSLLARLNKAQVYYLGQDYAADLVDTLLEESAQILTKIESARQAPFYHKTKCGDYFRRGEFIAAIDECLTALRLSKAFGEINETASIYDHLSEVYGAHGDFKNALLYSDTLYQIRDSLVYQENNRQIAELETKYESAIKDAEIVDQQRVIMSQRTTTYSLIGGVIVAGLLALMIFLWATYKDRLKSRELEIKTEKLKSFEQTQKIVALDYMMQGQQEERKRVAMDLHDGLGAILSSARLQVQRIQTEIEKLDNMNLIAKADELLSSASSEVRRIAHNMMPDALINLGLKEAIEDLTDQINQTSSLKVETHMYVSGSIYTEQQELFIYRIIQELLNNVIKHAKASTVNIELTESHDACHLTVTDDGVGFDDRDAKGSEGIGLRSVRSRVNYLDGELTIESKPGQGSTFDIVIPK